MRCLMFGNFWQGELRLTEDDPSNPAEGMTPFVGVIELDEDGNFTGVAGDEYGEANVQGTITLAALQFSKQYTLVRPGKIVGSNLQYLLRGSAINEGHGGWWGTYTQDGEEPNTPRGQAICTIHPDPSA